MKRHPAPPLILCDVDTMRMRMWIAPEMAVIHLSETDNKIYGQEGMCVN